MPFYYSTDFDRISRGSFGCVAICYIDVILAGQGHTQTVRMWCLLKITKKHDYTEASVKAVEVLETGTWEFRGKNEGVIFRNLTAKGMYLQDMGI